MIFSEMFELKRKIMFVSLRIIIITYFLVRHWISAFFDSMLACSITQNILHVAFYMCITQFSRFFQETMVQNKKSAMNIQINASTNYIKSVLSFFWKLKKHAYYTYNMCVCIFDMIKKHFHKSFLMKSAINSMLWKHLSNF